MKPEAPPPPASLRFLTWNLAMFDQPAEAPHGWTQSHTEAVVRELVLAVEPDVVLFQELPGLVPYVETHAMVKANPQSHSGHLATLVAHPLMEAAEPRIDIVDRCGLLVTFDHLDLTIANVHLESGKGADGERLAQVVAVAEAAPGGRLVIAGDTNTRISELADIESLGLVSTKPPQPTWDSRRNRFRDGMPEFSAYFTRWISGGPVRVDGVTVHTEAFEYEGRSFHISDHYALSGTITPA